MPGIPTPPHVHMLYKNHRGEYSVRRVIPMANWTGSSEHHPEINQSWFMDVIDIDKGAQRTFHMLDILAIGSVNINIYLQDHSDVREVVKHFVEATT